MESFDVPCRYGVGDHVLSSGDVDFDAALSSAYARKLRPLCLCIDPPAEMYLARLSSRIAVKRMPGTGPRHAQDCPHYQSQEEAEATVPLLGSAIQEDPASGRTVLRLEASLSSRPGGAQGPVSSRPRDEVKDRGRRLSLGDLLRYLWSEAGLNQWRPEWSGRRSWGTVRRRLLESADGKYIGRRALRALLLVPEPFTPEHREEIDARHVARLRSLCEPGPGGERRIGLMLAELKQLVPGRLGRLAVLKHLPDRPLVADDALVNRLMRRYEEVLDQWNEDPSSHLVVLATFAVRENRRPVIRECTVALANENWTLRPAAQHSPAHPIETSEAM